MVDKDLIEAMILLGRHEAVIRNETDPLRNDFLFGLTPAFSPQVQVVGPGLWRRSGSRPKKKRDPKKRLRSRAVRASRKRNRK